MHKTCLPFCFDKMQHFWNEAYVEWAEMKKMKAKNYSDFDKLLLALSKFSTKANKMREEQLGQIKIEAFLKQN